MSIVISHFYQKAQSMASFLAKDFFNFFRSQKKKFKKNFEIFQKNIEIILNFVPGIFGILPRDHMK